MRFSKLHLEKYGLYEDRSIVFRRGADLHLIVGRNEAGKTSALSAIGDLLFGFPNVSTYAIEYSPNILRVGAELELRNGQRIAFRRRKGRANTIIDTDDKQLGDDLLAPILGNLERQVFEAEFGLTSESLRIGGGKLLAANGSLAESLAAGSAGLSALSHRRTLFQSEADEIFTVRKVASKTFYLAADSYTETTRQLREAIVTSDAVKNAQGECARIVELQKALDIEHENLTRELQRLRRAVSTEGKLRQLSAREKELAGFQDLPDVDVDSVARWHAALQSEAETKRQITEVQRQLGVNDEAIAALVENPELLAAASDIDVARDARGAADQSRQHLPNREQARHAAWSRLEIAAGALGLKSPQELLGKMPKRPQIAGIREQVQQRRERELHKRSLEELYKKAQKQHADMNAESVGYGHNVDPAALERAFESFEDVPGDAVSLRRLSADIKQELHDIDVGNARLSPPPPPLGDLIRLSLPDVTRVDAARGIRTRHVRDLEAVDEKLSKAFSAIETVERDLKRMDTTGELATRDDLHALRESRDGIVTSLGGETGASAAGRDKLMASLQAINNDIDRVTDNLLANADRAAKKIALEQEAADKCEDIERHKLEKRSLVETGKESDRQWRALWAGVDIEPGSPDEMAKWLVSIGHSINRYDALSLKKKDVGALKEKLEGQKKPLSVFLKKLEIDALEEMPVDQLHEDARRGLTDLRERWTEQRLQAQKLDDAAQQIRNIESDLQQAASEESERRAEWAAAMQALRCDENAGIGEANEAIRIWDEAIAENEKYQDEDYRLTGIQKDIQEFEARIAGLCEKVAPDLVVSNAFLAVDQLVKRSQEARDVVRELAQLRKVGAGLKKQSADLQHRHEAALTELGHAAGKLAVTDQGAIGPALELLRRRDILIAEIAEIKSDLSSIANGQSVVELLAEQEGLDHDGLPGEIERGEIRAAQLLEEIKKAAIASRVSELAVETLVAGRNAAALAQQKEEVAAELLDVSQRWLVRAAAARLAAQAIERHRQSAQDPVIARASELFARATGGAYDGLGVQFDDDQPVFAAVRTGGSFVSISGLSDGTRDQLYLALRLALLEQRQGENLPFIGDDILTSFDDERTGQAIHMLAEFGKSRQTILFSHHRHVADIAQACLGDGLDLIEL